MVGLRPLIFFFFFFNGFERFELKDSALPKDEPAGVASPNLLLQVWHFRHRGPKATESPGAP